MKNIRQTLLSAIAPAPPVSRLLYINFIPPLDMQTMLSSKIKSLVINRLGKTLIHPAKGEPWTITHFCRVASAGTRSSFSTSSSSTTALDESDEESKTVEITSSSSELDTNLRPFEVVEALNKHIVGQHDAKRAVAIAMRNRWRRKQLPEDLRKEVTPRNVLLVGPTGSGKTEVARRMAQLNDAPFSKYTVDECKIHPSHFETN